MKEIFYDWGDLNVWLFHAINNARSEYLDQFMLLGTVLGEHTWFALYLALIALFALVMVARMPLQNSARYQAQVTRWMTIVAVFSVAYLLDGLLIGFLKLLLDFPRPPLALPSGTVYVIGEPEYQDRKSVV